MAAGHVDSLWWHDLPEGERGARECLAGDDEADVVIVGAGYTGLWTAYYLLDAQPELRVVVLERWVAGAGASGRNGGWCSSLLPVGWDQVAATYGRAAAMAWQRAADATLGEISRVVQREAIHADLKVGGYLKVASNRAQMRRLIEELDEARDWGRGEEDLYMLDVEESARRIRASRSLGALFTPHCASVQPARLVRGLARAVERKGGVILEGTSALRVEPGRVVTPRGQVRARTVVNAVEGYLARLPGHRRSRLPMRSVMVATEKLPESFWDSVGWRDGETFNDARRGLFYAQRTREGRIAIGGRGAPYAFGSGTADPAPGTARRKAAISEVLVEQFPALAGVRAEYVWSGVLGAPRDWMPSVSFDPRTRMGTAGGYSGDGVALTNLAGRTLADLILGRDTPECRLPWVGHPSPAWEPEPLRWAGVTAAAWLAASADRDDEAGRAGTGLRGRLFTRLTGH